MTNPESQSFSTPPLPEISAHGPLDLIRERVAALPDLELNDHCNEYDAIHTELERALSKIEVN